VTSRHKIRGRPILIELAVTDDDYYAQIHYQLRYQPEAQRAFERAVDDAWDARQAQQHPAVLP